jgi:phosphoserine aminotransferase
MSVDRIFNFSAGPAVMPLAVLEEAQRDLVALPGVGMSVMEISHRSRDFIEVAAEAESDLRTLLDVPSDYRVLFLQGGATGLWAGIPLNLTASDAPVDYVLTGHWSVKAVREARNFCSNVHVAADAREGGYTHVPAQAQWQLRPNAAYVHYCPNETIGGVEFPFIPETGGVPLVADFSSSILSRPLDVRRFGVIYASTQKNIGPAGLCLVIVHESLLGRARTATPTVWNWQTMAGSDSMANTPPTLAWYVSGLVFKWLHRQGGLVAMGERNRRKASTLYAAIDASGFYTNRVDRACRSLMNVPFHLADPALDADFLKGAQAAGLVQLKGHRLQGGMRASIYNAMPLAGVQALVDYMRDFEARRG